MLVESRHHHQQDRRFDALARVVARQKPRQSREHDQQRYNLRLIRADVMMERPHHGRDIPKPGNRARSQAAAQLHDDTQDQRTGAQRRQYR